MTSKDFVQLLKSAGAKWSQHNAPRLGAALAYYTLLSMAPLLILAVGICGLVLSKTDAERDLLGQVRDLAGYSGAKAVQQLLDNTHQASTGIFATVIAVVTLLFGASGVFIELQDSLNTIWDAPRRTSSSWRNLVRQRLSSFGMVLSLGFLLLVSLLATSGIAIAEKFFGQLVPIHFALVGEAVNMVISIVAIAFLFGLGLLLGPDLFLWRRFYAGLCRPAWAPSGQDRTCGRERFVRASPQGPKALILRTSI